VSHRRSFSIQIIAERSFSPQFEGKMIGGDIPDDDSKVFLECEVRLLISLIRPNIISVFESFESDNLLSLIFEDAEGETLEFVAHE
jgi:serine/threonine protein kinase